MQICSPSNNRRLVLLAPPDARVGEAFSRTTNSPSAHETLKRKMQRLRGRLYVKDGAIAKAALSPDGRHILAADETSWHLLTVDEHSQVLGCTRYLQHGKDARFEDLGISESPLAGSSLWSATLRTAVETDLRRAAASGFSYVEVGGWAMAEEVRCTAECLRSVLATYAWSRLIGGAIGVSTATERNGSASILRRLGGESLSAGGQEIPGYHDTHYGCGMQLLRYDSRKPNPRYEDTIRGIGESMSDIQVICAERPAWKSVFPGFTAVSPTKSADSAMMRQAA